jgi:hypothetical protein
MTARLDANNRGFLAPQFHSEPPYKSIIETGLHRDPKQPPLMRNNSNRVEHRMEEPHFFNPKDPFKSFLYPEQNSLGEA